MLMVRIFRSSRSCTYRMDLGESLRLSSDDMPQRKVKPGVPHTLMIDESPIHFHWHCSRERLIQESSLFRCPLKHHALGIIEHFGPRARGIRLHRSGSMQLVLVPFTLIHAIHIQVHVHYSQYVIVCAGYMCF